MRLPEESMFRTWLEGADPRNYDWLEVRKSDTPQDVEGVYVEITPRLHVAYGSDEARVGRKGGVVELSPSEESLLQTVKDQYDAKVTRYGESRYSESHVERF